MQPDAEQRIAANGHGLLAARVRLALRSLDVAIAATKPFAIRALFSGGGDSMVATHIAARHEFFGGCVFIDTGTALPGVIEFAQEVCEAQGWPLSVIRSPQTYEDMIVRNGLPGPGQHPTAYVRLKEKALDAHVRALCTRCAAGERHVKHDTVMWISGARASESMRRMGQSGWVTVDGSQVWVNPILDWDNSECRAYRDLCNLPTSDVAAMVHRSGECNCGTYAATGEREMLRDLYPEFAARMDGWEALARAHGHDNAAVWGQRPTKRPKDQLEIPRAGELACSGCAARFEGENDLEEVA